MSIDDRERLLQTLSAMLLQLHMLQTGVNGNASEAAPLDLPALRNGLTSLERMTRDALAVVLTSTDDVLPPELEDTTLAQALSQLVEETAEKLNLSSRVLFSGVDEEGRTEEHSLLPAVERVLYMMARETLYQVEHHTGARKLRLSLSYGPDDVQMSIEDDGTNIEAKTPAPPFAEDTTISKAYGALLPTSSIMDTLRLRVEQFGGSLTIGPAGEQGTRVIVRVPYTQQVQAQMGAEPAMAAPPPVPIEPVRILIVAAQAVTRAGLHRLLEAYPGLQVVGEAADGVQAVSETLELGPRVVLMDLQLPNGQSLEALRQIKQLNLDTKVLLLSSQEREEYLYEILRAGANGYVLKDIAPDELVQAVQAAARDELLIQPQLASRLLSRFGKQGRGAHADALTARELDVLRLLARGLRNKEIAARLFISERTVNFHLANIYQKLNVSGRTEALSKALEQGLITA
ncbi:MAG TPA: LuxR C-terminal-related transcriptional regulator [Ktedonobacteraceae bacterium]|nr:LuxR C-terminal-related transcriptional regulator [Ktedonobacteraceae bacterium]